MASWLCKGMILFRGDTRFSTRYGTNSQQFRKIFVRVCGEKGRERERVAGRESKYMANVNSW